MSFLKKFKRSKTRKSPMSNMFEHLSADEKKMIYKRAVGFLNDDETQNSFYRATAPAGLFPHCRKTGKTPDENPNATGDFGHSPNNPIPCNGPLGEMTYLSSLTLEKDNQKIFFQRSGSVAGNGIDDNIVDEFSIISQDGKFAGKLYLDMNHPGKSSKVPTGYIRNTPITAIRGITTAIENFPSGLYEAINEEMMMMCPIPLADSAVKDIDVKEAINTLKNL